MEQALALKNNHLPQESEFQILQVISRNAASCGLYTGIGAEQKIFMILLAARELGVPPMQALNGGIWNIQGKIEISARLMGSMIRRGGNRISILHSDSEKCVIEGKRADTGDTFTSQFTIEDAKKAGLVRNNRDGSPGIWMKYAEDLLYARCLSRLARRLFPDVIGTAYVEGEIKDAKCEIIATIQEEEKPEDPEQVEVRMLEFLQDHPDEDWQMIRTYILKYASHWKKGVIQSLDEYLDKEKFLNDFSKWKSKQSKAA